MTDSTTPVAVSEPGRDLLRGEAGLFRVAAAVIIVAVGDAAFVHRDPGTSAGDHLASGLAPVAIALALALAYPHLRAGLRATVALICGVLAVVAGVSDGIRHVVIDRVSGDDVTASLGALAGAALLLLGAVVLWRSRRVDGSLTRRSGRRALKLAGMAVIALLVIVPIGIAIVATNVARSPVPAAQLGASYRPVTFPTTDGLTLTGWYVASRNGAAVIVSPGRSASVQQHARMLIRHGYGVLVFDRRGEGQSQGDPNLYGWKGDEDLLGAIAFLKRQPDVQSGRIGGLGLSVGGEMLLQTAAETTALRAVVSEGAGARSLREHLHTPGLGRVQRWIAPSVVQTGAVAVLSNTSPPADLAQLVGRIAPRPILLIRALRGHGDESLNRVYYAAAHQPKSLWEVAQGGHTGAMAARPREYDRRVVGFFDRALLAHPGLGAGSTGMAQGADGGEGRAGTLAS